jgi:hypothetical protein
MKRSELEVGQDYVVLAPSQRVDKNYLPTGKRARVLDTEPVWTQAFIRTWAGLPVATLEGFDGEQAEAKDKSELDRGAKEGTRFVRCLVGNYESSDWYADEHGGSHWRYTIEAVAISQLRMPWDDFKALKDAKDTERDLRYKAMAVIDRERERNAKRINELLKVAGSQVRAKVSARRGVILEGPVGDLLELAEQLAAVCQAADQASLRDIGKGE